MLIEIGKATASGTQLSLWAVFQPLVLSIAFCGIGAVMAFPMDRKGQGWVKKYLLCWVGFWPTVIPPHQPQPQTVAPTPLQERKKT